MSGTPGPDPHRPTVVVRTFQPGDEEAFRRLNEAWISRYFTLEAKDVETLCDPRGSILSGGGQIFIALLGDHRAGCCALVPMPDPAAYELVKMAVDERFHGRGLGRALMLAAIEWARHAGARRLWLETNHVLTPAIRLYESVGFRHIDRPRQTASVYQRSDVQMELALDEQ